VRQSVFGFGDGGALFESVHTCFEWLPVACVVENKVMVLHGGIGRGVWSIDDLDAVKRPIAGLDPVEGDDAATLNVRAMLLEVRVYRCKLAVLL
jgi:hypothetical protein